MYIYVYIAHSKPYPVADNMQADKQTHACLFLFPGQLAEVFSSVAQLVADRMVTGWGPAGWRATGHCRKVFGVRWGWLLP